MQTARPPPQALESTLCDSGPIISLKQKNICRSHVISKSVQLYGKTFSKKRQSKDKLWMKANDYDVFF